MTDKEKFIRFKNSLLGPTFLNDGTHFARILGRDHFQFWSHIEEKAPYLPPTIPLSDVTKGQIILERIEIEPSPKRMADLLQGLYNTFAFYSTTPEGDYDDTWLQFSRWLQGHIKSSDLSGMQVKWIEEPEVCYTPKPLVERYYIPGELKIRYVGQDWAEVESKKILENGFSSRVLKVARESQKLDLKNKLKGTKIISSDTFPKGIVNWTKWALIVGLIVGLLTIFVGPYFYNTFFIPKPILEYLLSGDGENFLFAIKNAGDVGIKNLSVTYLSEVYLITDDYEGFAGTGFVQKSKFDQPGENWLTSDYLPPKSLPFEKEFHPGVVGDVGKDQYISVEVMNVYYQRENDLKKYQEQIIFVSQNKKIYTEAEARLIPKYSAILDKLPSIMDKKFPHRDINGVQKLN